MRARAAGFTLVEMLVVLTLLAIVAGIAITATEGLVEQSRFDATRRTLENVEEAVLGAPGLRQPDGTPIASGFVADLGRLPEFVDSAEPGERLQELWIRPVGVPDCAPRQPVAADLVTVLDAEVRVTAGWRGPYLRLPLGAATLVDGWTRPFGLLAADDAEIVAAGASVEIIRTLGADGLAGGGGYDLDLETAFARTAAPAQTPRHVADVSGTVTKAGAAGANLVLRVYGPVDGSVRQLAHLTEAAGLTSIPGSSPPAFTFQLTGLPVGTRALRAYDPAATLAPDAAVLAGTPRSRVAYVVIPSGGLSGLAITIE